MLKRLRNFVGVCVISLFVVSCATTSSSDYCLIYKPIPTSLATPEEVQLIIDDNNIAWLGLCTEVKL